LFIDDRLINVEAAEAIGLRSHLFTTAEDLRARLEVEGLL
jgi:2-haloacid dehalogenase